MIIPVIDLLAGRVVRGIGGRRSEYLSLVPESDPLNVARFFRDCFGLATLYLADLDAIAGSPPVVFTYHQLLAEGFTLWVDAGVRRTHDADALVRAGVARIIAGSETLDGPKTLTELVRTWTPARIVFSLDLKLGRPLASPTWQADDPLTLAVRAGEAGAQSILVLDLSRVGVGEGTGTEELCRACRQRWPDIELIAGGGVRGPDDLRRLRDLGVNHVLAASALHDGRLSRADVTQS